MKPENIISAAQARLNFCDPEYVALYKEINNQILEKSRKQTYIRVEGSFSSTARDTVIKDLRGLGYAADYYFVKHDKDTQKNIFAIDVSW